VFLVSFAVDHPIGFVCSIQLEAEKERVLAEKRKLGRRLRQFEDNFQQQTGR
jgi:hypothetical protein